MSASANPAAAAGGAQATVEAPLLKVVSADVPASPRSKAQKGDEEFMREVDAARLQKGPGYAHGVLWVTLAFVVSALVWASYATVGETTVGDGKVVPSSQVQVVQNLEGGIVSEIKVGLGDVVRKNQVLMVSRSRRPARA